MNKHEYKAMRRNKRIEQIQEFAKTLIEKNMVSNGQTAMVRMLGMGLSGLEIRSFIFALLQHAKTQKHAFEISKIIHEFLPKEDIRPKVLSTILMREVGMHARVGYVKGFNRAVADYQRAKESGAAL